MAKILGIEKICRYVNTIELLESLEKQINHLLLVFQNNNPELLLHLTNLGW